MQVGLYLVKTDRFQRVEKLSTLELSGQKAHPFCSCPNVPLFCRQSRSKSLPRPSSRLSQFRRCGLAKSPVKRLARSA